MQARHFATIICALLAASQLAAAPPCQVAQPAEGRQKASPLRAVFAPGTDAQPNSAGAAGRAESSKLTDPDERGVQCPCFDGFPENEPDCGIPVDTVDGGCNSSPPVSIPVSCGDVVCGTAAFDTK